MITKDQWYEVTERSRTYVFPGGESVTFFNVTRIRVSPGGTHFFEDVNGLKYFMAKTWLYVVIDGEWIDGHA